VSGGEFVLCVDDDPTVQRLIGRMLEASGLRCAYAGSVAEARALLAELPFALVLCDINLPGSSGLDLLAELTPRSPDIATVMVTGRDDPELAGETLEGGAYGYLTKPFSHNALLIQVRNALHRRRLELERRDYEQLLEETVARRTEQLRHAYEETVLRLGRAIEYHDGETGAHVERVGAYARSIARALGLPEQRAELLRLAAPLHDIGKIAVRESVLLKPGRLSEEERTEMQRHAEAGHELLDGSGNELLELAATIAWTHHERWDGSGYPRGLRGEEIPLEGRIVAVADVFDALATDRPYRRRLEVVDARAWIVAERGVGFDPRVVDAFLGSLDSLVLARASESRKRHPNRGGSIRRIADVAASPRRRHL
jgi:putative two-component system response regulator